MRLGLAIAAVAGFIIWGALGGFILWGHLTSHAGTAIASGRAAIEIQFWIGGLIFLGVCALLSRPRIR